MMLFLSRIKAIGISGQAGSTYSESVASRSSVDLDVFSLENLLAEFNTLHHGPAEVVSTFGICVGLSGGEASIFESLDYNAVINPRIIILATLIVCMFNQPQTHSNHPLKPSPPHLDFFRVLVARLVALFPIPLPWSLSLWSTRKVAVFEMGVANQKELKYHPLPRVDYDNFSRSTFQHAKVLVFTES
jgi:hypothetical protein